MKSNFILADNTYEMSKRSRKAKNWSQPYRVECVDYTYLITARCIRSELWFVNNPQLGERIKAFAAKYAKEYGIKLYAFEIVGNHYHLVAKFSRQNASDFFRDLNARIAESVRMLVDEFEGGPLFERRYTIQALPEDADVENCFFYCALQVVSSGLCARLSEYPGYNFFPDAISGVSRIYKYFAYGEYNEAVRRNRGKKIDRADYFKEFEFRFERLPSYEHLSQKDYQRQMLEKFEKRRIQLVENSKARFRTKAELRKVRPGTKPHKTKKGGSRPLVLSANPEARKSYLEFYFNKVRQFKDICFKYRRGEFEIEFPPGMYRPPGLAIVETYR